jgi:hypothetical protein
VGPKNDIIIKLSQDQASQVFGLAEAKFYGCCRQYDTGDSHEFHEAYLPHYNDCIACHGSRRYPCLDYRAKNSEILHREQDIAGMKPAWKAQAQRVGEVPA